MADIGVVHADIFQRGGAELVGMHVLEALQDDHDVTLLTLTDPDFPTLNSYYDTGVKGVAVQTLTGPWGVGSTFAGAASRVGLGNLRRAFFNRMVNKCADEYDLLVSTDGEYALKEAAVMYVHFPNFYRSRLQQYLHYGGLLHAAYDFVSRRTAGVSSGTVSSSLLVANSHWTADLVKSVYGNRPKVLYPPVDTSPFDPQPWGQKENGFVCVGKIDPSKHVLRNIRIIRALRDRGHDVHLHVVGPVGDDEYGQKVRETAAASEFVSFEGPISRADLVSLLCRHRYGIHGKENEHFGLVVAEFVAGGMIPFVPDSGGQTEIVDGLPELRYGTESAAIELADAVLSSEKRQWAVRDSLPEVESRFGRRQFTREIRAIVNDAL